MNHQFYSINVTNSANKEQGNTSSSGVLLEKELKEIYETQYNDLFPKILTKTNTEFISLLKEKVSLHLKIINKNITNSLNIKYLDLFTKKYLNDKNKATKGLEEILKNADLQEKYLDLLNCYIHCHKCSKILHKCKNKIIFYKNYIYCIRCQKVYNENQIKLYCQECKVYYYTKLRYIINKRYEYFYPVAFKQYHCPLDEQEKIKCLECGQDLFYNITYESNNHRNNTIKEVFCLKCKLLYDMNDIYFNCKICKSEFKSEAILYNNFSILKEQFLLLVHTFQKKKYALPDANYNRKCKCDISKYEKYLHENDNGVLYLGINLEGQYIIVCDVCYSIFKYNDFTWNCPVCQVNFRSKKIYSKNDYHTAGSGFERKLDKNEYMFKSPSHANINPNKIYFEGSSSAGFKINSGNIVKNLFKIAKNDTNKNDTNDKKDKPNIKREYKNKIILLTKDIINDEKNINFSEKKSKLFKKLNSKDKKIRFNTNYDTLKGYEANNGNSNLKDYINRQAKINNNGAKKLVNSISFINNKSETNSNKEFIEHRESNESTAHITSRNYDAGSEKYNDLNNYVSKCSSCIIENDSKKKYSLNNNNNKINRKLVYDDFVENKNNNQKEYNYKLFNVIGNRNDERKNYLQKSKTCMDKGNLGIKDEKRQTMKRIDDDIIKKPDNKNNLIIVKSKENIIKKINSGNDATRRADSQSNIKKDESRQNTKRGESKENTKVVEFRNVKKVESKNNIKRIESKDNIKNESKESIKRVEPKDEAIKRSEPKDNIKRTEPRDNMKRVDSKESSRIMEPRSSVKRVESKDIIKRNESRENVKKYESKNIIKINESKDNIKKYEIRNGIKKFDTKDNIKKTEYRNNIKNSILKEESKRFQSKDNITKNKDIKKIDNKKEYNICKTDKKPRENAKFVVIKKGNLNHEKAEVKKINLTLFNSFVESAGKKENIISEGKSNCNVYKRNYNSQNKAKNNVQNKLIIEKKDEKDKKDAKIISDIYAQKKINNSNQNNNIKNKDNYNNKKDKEKDETNKNNINKSKDKNNNADNSNTNANIDLNNNSKNKDNKDNKDNKEDKEDKENKEVKAKEDSKKSKKEKEISIFDKIKKYYEESIFEDHIVPNSPKSVKKYKDLQFSPEKKSEYKNDFNSDNYSILKLLGKGTYGKTYLVEDPQTKERFALKKIIINDKYELIENEEELNLILKLTNEYPELKIIKIFGIEQKKLDKYNIVMYVLMEAANCDWEKELISRCETRFYYTEEQLIEILTNLVRTFAILQEIGISHRDVKPQNILSFGNNEYKISDFGEAKNVQEFYENNNIKKSIYNNYAYQDNTMKQTLRGTELYMSPILFMALRSHRYQFVKYNSYKSDVFSLGMCLFLASSLDYEGLYEVREIIKNPDKTRLVVNRYLSLRYSQKYINILISMLQINEKDRPDFIELQKIVGNLKK